MNAVNESVRGATKSHTRGTVDNTLQTYLVLSTGKLNLILPQSSISKVQHLSRENIRKIHATHHILHQNTILDGKILWFAALSDHFTLLSELPENRFLLTTFTDFPNILWCWYDLYQVNSEQIKRFSIPSIVTTSDTPVQALAILSDHKHAFFTSPEHICRFVLRGNM